MNLPRGIRARGSSYIVDVTVAGKRRTITCKTLEEAKAKRLEVQLTMVRGEDPKAEQDASRKAWTLKQAVDKTVELVWDSARSSRTSKINAQAALDFFGPDLRLDHLDTEALDRYVEHLKSIGNSDGTINRKLAAVRKAMTTARARGGCTVIPEVPRRKEAAGRIRYMTLEEEQRLHSLLRAWSKPNHLDGIIVLTDTGMRSGELIRVAVRDLDFEAGKGRGVVYCWENKANHPRGVPMTKRVREILLRRAEGLGQTDLLFPYDKFWLRYTWDRAKIHMGLAKDDQFVVHALRHTCASRLVQKGVPIKVVQEWLGHKCITTTMRYAHLAPTSLFDAAAGLEQLKHF